MTDRKRVMFVDDEVQILEGLQNLLRKHRRQWDMVFAPGGPAALAAFEQGPFDVIVSDMRMPGMDGAALLTQVRERYPATVRIVLSGHAEQDAMLQALPVAHQFRTKPCDAAVLRGVVERACSLSGLVPDPRLRAALGRIERLHSQPRAYFGLTEAFAQADPGPEVTRIAGQDPAMAAKLLQIANSGYFGHGETLSVAQAVRGLGIELIRTFALTARVFGVAAPGDDGVAIERLSVAGGLAARLVERFTAEAEPAQRALAVTVALFQRVGLIALAGVHDAPTDTEAQTKAAAYLLGVWGVPATVTDLLLAVASGEPAASPLVGALRAATFFSDAGLGRACCPSFDPTPWRALADETLAQLAS